MTPEEEIIREARPIRGALGCLGFIVGSVTILKVAWMTLWFDPQLVVIVVLTCLIGLASLTGDDDVLFRSSRRGD